MAIPDWKIPFGLHGLCKNCQRFKGYQDGVVTRGDVYTAVYRQIAVPAF